MNALLIAFVAYTVVFGLLWHNQSSRAGDPEPLKPTPEQAKTGAKPAHPAKEDLAARSMHDWLKG